MPDPVLKDKLQMVSQRGGPNHHQPEIQPVPQKRRKLNKESDGVKSHSSIIADTPMINSKHAGKQKVGGMISQLNSNAMEHQSELLNRTQQSSSSFAPHANKSNHGSRAYQAGLAAPKSGSRPTSSQPLSRVGANSGQLSRQNTGTGNNSRLYPSKNSSVRSTNGSPQKQQFNQYPFSKIPQVYQMQPESVVNDVLSSDLEEESAIFHERPSQKHNDSVSSARMVLQHSQQKTTNFNRKQPSASKLTSMLSQRTAVGYNQIERQNVSSSSNPYFKRNVIPDEDNTDDGGENGDDQASIDDDDDDSNTLSDRFLMDSARSNLGVNVPMNSLPKLSRHRKSDLLASELEGSPQKPTVAEHFAKRRIAAPTSKKELAPSEHQVKIEDSGIPKEKVIFAGTLSSVLPPETSVFGESEKLDQNDLKQSCLSQLTVSQGFHKEPTNGVVKDDLSTSSNNIFRRTSQLIPTTGPHQQLQKPLQGITPNKMTKSMLSSGVKNEARASGTNSRRRKASGKNSQRLSTFNQFFGNSGKQNHESDALCLEDLATSNLKALDSPRIADPTTSIADENVGETTPNGKREQKVNLSASENLSQSQYLSNSFQNSKRSSQLMQILKMSSLTNSQIVNSGTASLHKKMEVAQRHPVPHLLSGTRQKKEKVNYRIQPRAAGAKESAPHITVKSTNFPSPSKMARLQSKRDSGELSGRKTVIQSGRDSKTPSYGQKMIESGVGSNQKRIPYPAIGAQSKSRKNEPHSLSVRHGLEPMKMMNQQHSQGAQQLQRVNQVQRVKESGMIKRASFIDDSTTSGVGAVKKTTNVTQVGSFIRDEQLPNRVNNVDQIKVSDSQKRTDEAEIVSIEVIEGTGAHSFDQTEVRHSQLLTNARQGSHIGAAALQRGMSPPAHVKEVSSDSRSSANIIENLSPKANRIDQKSLNNSHSHLTKYNRSAYKLKQYISDVNKINAKQQKKSTNITKGKKPGTAATNKGSKKNSNLDKGQISANDSQVYTKKAPQTGNQMSQSQLTTQMTTKPSKSQLLKNQQSQKRVGQRSTSPQETSLSRVLSYCPTSSHRISHTRQNIFSQSSSAYHKGQTTFAAGQQSSSAQSNEIYSSSQQRYLNIKHKAKHCLTLPRFFRALLSFLDFLSLFTVMQTRKDYRWDVCSRGKGYQPQTYWVHKEIRKRMKQILLKDGGLRSTVERRNLWIYRSKLNKIKQRYPQNHFDELVDKYFRHSLLEQPKMSEIGKDVSRTFPDLQFFQKDQPGQKKLHRILTALSMFRGLQDDGTYEDEVLGYTQGLNFIAGTALVHLQQHEENTFWFLVSILFEHKFRNVFNFLSEGTFRVLCFQLEVLTQVYLPDLHEHLTRNKVPTDIYASNWFITLFVNDLPFDMAPSVLDVFLLEGHKGLLRIALSILSFLRSELLQLHQDELLVFLSHTNAREQIFRGLDQYWLFQTSHTFKITSSLLSELQRLFILREKLSQLEQAYKKRKQQSDTAKDNPEWDSELVQFFKMSHFTRLRICFNQSKVLKRHEWHVLMLGPEDVENLMTEQGLPTDEIEELRVFYNTRIKERELGSVLTKIEKLVNEHHQRQNKQITPRQGSMISTTLDIAQENYLKATNKMVVNSNSISLVALEGANLARNASKESSLSLEITERQILPLPRLSLTNADGKLKGGMQKDSLRPLLKQAKASPGEGNTHLKVTKISPKSSSQQLNGQFSMLSTPKIATNNIMLRPVRHDNKYGDESLDDELLPYGSSAETTAQAQQPSLFQGWALDLGSKLGDLFRPLSISPVNARRAQQQPQRYQQSLYDSAKEVVHLGSTRPPRHMGNTASGNCSIRGGSTQNLSNRSRSLKNIGEENVDKRSPELQLSKLKVINNSTGTTKERKTMTPHMMLSGDDQIHVNASSSFDFTEAISKSNADESLKLTTKPGLTLPQKVQINESQFAYQATTILPIGADLKVQQRRSQHGSDMRSSSQSSSTKPQKPPRSTSTQVWHASQQQQSATVNEDIRIHSSKSLERINEKQNQSQNSLLRRVLSPRVKDNKQLQHLMSGSKQQFSVAQQTQQQQQHIHIIPESVVERKSIDKLNSFSHQQQQLQMQKKRSSQGQGYVIRLDTAPTGGHGATSAYNTRESADAAYSYF